MVNDVRIIPPTKERLNIYRVASYPTKNTYFVGESIDLTGIHIIRFNGVDYKNYYEDDIITDAPDVFTSPQDLNIRIWVEESDTPTWNFKVRVVEPWYTSIRVQTPPLQTQIEYGETPDYSGLVIYGTLPNGNEAEINSYEAIPPAGADITGEFRLGNILRVIVRKTSYMPKPKDGFEEITAETYFDIPLVDKIIRLWGAYKGDFMISSSYPTTIHYTSIPTFQYLVNDGFKLIDVTDPYTLDPAEGDPSDARVLVPVKVTTSKGFSQVFQVERPSVEGAVYIYEDETIVRDARTAAEGLETFTGIGNLLSIENPVATGPKYTSTTYQNSPEFHTLIAPSLVRVMDSTFKNCPKLAFVNLDSLKELYGNVFRNDIALEELNLPNLEGLYYGYNFAGCTGLKSVASPKLDWLDSHEFDGCINLESIDLSDCTHIGDYSFNNCSKLTIDEELPYVTSIGQYAFSKCNQLGNIIRLPRCTSVGNYAFERCGHIDTLEVPNASLLGTNSLYQTTARVIRLKEEPLVGNYSLDWGWVDYVADEIYAPKALVWERNTQYESYLYARMAKKMTVGSLRSSTFQGQHIGGFITFLSNLEDLTTRRIEKLDSQSTAYQGVLDLSYTSYLDVEEYMSGVITIRPKKFRFRGSDIPSTRNLDLTFNCDRLEEVVLDEMTNKGVQGSSYLSIFWFKNAPNLKRFEAPKFEVAYNEEFLNSGLETLSLPSLKRIYPNAFKGSTLLKSLTLASPTKVVLDNINAFEGTPFMDPNVTDAWIYVPAALENEYKSDPVWGQLSSRISTIL